jgi:hypothetical protein
MRLNRNFQQLNIPVEFIKIHHEADGNFPNGIPNPILIENRDSTRDAVVAHHADMGLHGMVTLTAASYSMKKVNSSKAITLLAYWHKHS